MTHLGRQTLKTLNKGIRTLLAVPDALLDALSTMGMTCFISRSANAQKQIDVATEYVDKLIKIAIVLSPPQKLLTLYFHKIKNNKTLDEYFSQFNYYKKVKDRYEKTGSIYDPQDNVQAIIYFLQTIANMLYVGIVGTLPIFSLFDAFKAMCLAIDYAKDPTEEPNIYAWVNKLYDMLIIDSEDYAKLHPSLETLPINPFFAFYADMIFTAIYLKNSYEQEIIPAIKRMHERRWIKYGYTTVDIYDDATKTTKRVFADNLTYNTINIKIDADIISPETLSVRLNHEGFVKQVGVFYSPLRIPAFFARKKKDWYGSFCTGSKQQLALLTNNGRIYIYKSNLKPQATISDNALFFDKILSLKNNVLVASATEQGITKLFNQNAELINTIEQGQDFKLLSVPNTNTLVFYKIQDLQNKSKIHFKVFELSSDCTVKKSISTEFETPQYFKIYNPPLTINQNEILFHSEKHYGVTYLCVSEHNFYTYDINKNKITLKNTKQYVDERYFVNLRFKEDDCITTPYRHVILPALFVFIGTYIMPVILDENFQLKETTAFLYRSLSDQTCPSSICYSNGFIAFKCNYYDFNYWYIGKYNHKDFRIERIQSHTVAGRPESHPFTISNDIIVLPLPDGFLLFDTRTNESKQIKIGIPTSYFISAPENIIYYASVPYGYTELKIFDLDKKQIVKTEIIGEKTTQFITL